MLISVMGVTRVKTSVIESLLTGAWFCWYGKGKICCLLHVHIAMDFEIGNSVHEMVQFKNFACAKAIHNACRLPMLYAARFTVVYLSVNIESAIKGCIIVAQMLEHNNGDESVGDSTENSFAK